MDKIIDTIRRQTCLFGFCTLVNGVILLNRVLAQPQVEQAYFAVGLTGGVSVTYLNWFFKEEGSDGKRAEGKMYPGASFTADVSYGPFAHFQGSELWTSLSLGYAETKTEEVQLWGNLFTGQAGIQRYVIMAWIQLTTDNSMSPFVKLGIGAAKTDFRELYTMSWARNIRFHRWNFASGGEAGVTYRLLQNLDVNASLIGWWTYERIHCNIPNYKNEKTG